MAFGDFIGSLLGFAVGDAVAGGVRFRELERKAKVGIYLCGVRVVSGRHPRLDSLWLPGEWKVSPGYLEFGRVRVNVQSIDRDAIRKGGRRDMLEGCDALVVPVRTQSAMLEWSVITRFAERAISVISAETPE